MCCNKLIDAGGKGKKDLSSDGSRGLVVMGRDSRSIRCGFESRHRILDGCFSHYFCKNCNVCFYRPKINNKRASGWPI